MIGYPNVGKSSLINTLRSKAVCKTAPIPGETKVWQYITLMKRIYLIDCPGVVPPSQGDSDSDLLLRGVVRVENVEYPAQYVAAALNICERRHIERTYNVRDWKTADEFLEALAEKSGKLMKGGERNMDGAAKMFLNDFLRGRVPWFVKPPGWGEAKKTEKGAAEGGKTKGDMTKLNQMAAVNARKRKRGDMEAEADATVEAEMQEEFGPGDGEDFENFSSGSEEGGPDPSSRDEAETDEMPELHPPSDDSDNDGGTAV